MVDPEIRSAVADRRGSARRTAGRVRRIRHPAIGDTQAVFETLVALDTDRDGLKAMARQRGVVLTGWLAQLLEREWTGDEFTAAMMARKRVANIAWRFFGPATTSC